MERTNGQTSSLQSNQPQTAIPKQMVEQQNFTQPVQSQHINNPPISNVSLQDESMAKYLEKVFSFKGIYLFLVA